MLVACYGNESAMEGKAGSHGHGRRQKHVRTVWGENTSVNAVSRRLGEMELGLTIPKA